VVPFAIEVAPALIATDCKVALLTVSVRLFEVIPFWDAVMLAVPAESPLASPFAFTVATAALDDFQVTDAVSVCVLPSLNVPTAAN